MEPRTETKTKAPAVSFILAIIGSGFNCTLSHKSSTTVFMISAHRTRVMAKTHKADSKKEKPK